MAGRSRERKAVLARAGPCDAGCDRSGNRPGTSQACDGRGAKVLHSDEGQYHEEVKAQEGQVRHLDTNRGRLIGPIFTRTKTLKSTKR